MTQPMTHDALLDATIAIVTHNRVEQLRDAVRSALAQEGDNEVLVIDDASTDGSADAIEREFPEARVIRSPVSQGYIMHRNEAARLARAPILVSIDDDAVFPSTRTVMQTVAEFDDPRIGAVAIPYVDVLVSQDVHQRAPDELCMWVASQYRGTAHALRVDVFNALGGYRKFLYHQAEEGEYCLRMMNAGYVVRLGQADPIHHLESPKRSRSRIKRQSIRNAILHTWWNVPMPYMPIRLVWVSMLACVHSVTRGDASAWLGGMFAGWRDLLRAGRRRPVSRRAYALERELFRHGPVPLESIATALPPARTVGAGSRDSPNTNAIMVGRTQ